MDLKKAFEKDKGIISLPSSSKRVSSLRNKHVEYGTRMNIYERSVMQNLAQGGLGTMYPNPDRETAHNIVGVSEGHYKYVLLGAVLHKGSVNSQDLATRLAEQGPFDRDNFYSACLIIYDYCKTGGKNLEKGTRLK